MERYFDDYLRLFPLTATLLGDSRYNDRFANLYSSTHRQAHVALLRRALRDCPARPDVETRAFRYSVTMDLEAYDYPLHLLPIDQMDNVFLTMVECLLEHQPMETHADVADLSNRLADFQVAATSLVECLQEGIRKRVVLPRLLCRQVIQQLQTLLTDEPYLKRKTPLREEYETCVRRYFVPAVRSTLSFLRETYLRACRRTVGYASLPNGQAMYDYLVRLHTTLDVYDDKKLYARAYEDTKRLFREKQVLRRQLPSHRVELPSSRKEAIEWYEEQKRVVDDTVLPKYFGTLRPEEDYEIRPVPSYMEEFSSTAYYTAPSLDGTRPGTFYVNTRNLSEHPRHKLEVLTLHEGNPGHHFQIALSMDLGIPRYRVFSNWNAYIEGWGLYCETLGEYKDGHSRLGKYDYELLRSIRILVDLGLHKYGWSLRRCRTLLATYTDLAATEIEAEVCRYVAMPGQALSYKVGEWSILGLRSGSIQDFHERILRAGPLPLWLLPHAI